MEPIKLIIGKLITSWRVYPKTRKELIRIPPGPPIFITGTHRSGTTWVAKMLARDGIWYIHEPYFSGKGLWRKNFAYINENTASPNADLIMEKLLKGGYRHVLNNPWTDHCLMPMRLLPPPRLKRILVKDPIACLMSEYLTRRFHFKTLVLFRHPAGFVESIIRLGWPTGSFISQFLEDESLMSDWLYPYRYAMEDVKNREDLKSAAVLHGCLNSVLWGFTNRNRSMKTLIFEKLCINPIENFKELYTVLMLPYNKEIQKNHIQLCFAKKKNESGYRPHEVRRNTKEMAERWRNSLSQKELTEIRSVWEKFDIPLYRKNKCW